MKRIFFVLILILALSVSCVNLDNYVTIEEYDRLEEEYTNLNKENDNSRKDIDRLELDNAELEEEINTLEDDLDLSKSQNNKLQTLICNLDNLLDNVYYVYGKNVYETRYTEVWGTGFSIKYNDKYYLITAGHIVDGEWGIHKNLGFKNSDGEWIYPELLTYENDNDNYRDYAILYSNKVDSGFNYNLTNTYDRYIIGNIDLNIIRKPPARQICCEGTDGECGSPVVNLNGEVIEVYVGCFTDINKVIEAINSLK
jgi:cell division protein FtsB